MAEFDWWLLILGLLVGGGLTYLVLADMARREVDLEVREQAAEARWLSERLAERGIVLDPEETLEVLREHRAYLRLPPPDEIEPVEPVEPLEPPTNR